MPGQSIAVATAKAKAKTFSQPGMATEKKKESIRAYTRTKILEGKHFNRVAQGEIVLALMEEKFSERMITHFTYAVTYDATRGSELTSCFKKPRFTSKPQSTSTDPLNLLVIHECLLRASILNRTQTTNNFLLELANFMRVAHKEKLFNSPHELTRFLGIVCAQLNKACAYDQYAKVTLQILWPFVAQQTGQSPDNPDQVMGAYEYEAAQKFLFPDQEGQQADYQWKFQILRELFEKRFSTAEIQQKKQWELLIYNLSVSFFPANTQIHSQIIKKCTNLFVKDGIILDGKEVEDKLKALALQAGTTASEQHIFLLNHMIELFSKDLLLATDVSHGLITGLRYSTPEMQSVLVATFTSALGNMENSVSAQYMAMYIDLALGEDSQYGASTFLAIQEICKELGVNPLELSLSHASNTTFFKMFHASEAINQLPTKTGKKETHKDEQIQAAKQVFHSTITIAQQQHDAARTELKPLIDQCDRTLLELSSLIDQHQSTLKSKLATVNFIMDYKDRTLPQLHSAIEEATYDPILLERLTKAHSELSQLRASLNARLRPAFNDDDEFKNAILSSLVTKQNFKQGKANTVKLDYDEVLDTVYSWHPEKYQTCQQLSSAAFRQKVTSVLTDQNDFITFTKEYDKVQQKIQELQEKVSTVKSHWDDFIKFTWPPEDNTKAARQTIEKHIDDIANQLTQCNETLEQLLSSPSSYTDKLKKLDNIHELANQADEQVIPLRKGIDKLQTRVKEYNKLCPVAPVWGKSTALHDLQNQLNAARTELGNSATMLITETKQTQQTISNYIQQRQALASFYQHIKGKIGAVISVKCNANPSDTYETISQMLADNANKQGIKLSKTDIDKLSIAFMHEYMLTFQEQHCTGQPQCSNGLDQLLVQPNLPQNSMSHLEPVEKHARSMREMQCFISYKVQSLHSSNILKRLLNMLTFGYLGKSQFRQGVAASREHTTALVKDYDRASNTFKSAVSKIHRSALQQYETLASKAQEKLTEYADRKRNINAELNNLANLVQSDQSIPRPPPVERDESSTYAEPILVAVTAQEEKQDYKSSAPFAEWFLASQDGGSLRMSSHPVCGQG